VGRNFSVTVGRAAWEACCTTWNLGTNSASQDRRLKIHCFKTDRTDDITLRNHNLVTHMSYQSIKDVSTNISIMLFCWTTEMSGLDFMQDSKEFPCSQSLGRLWGSFSLHPSGTFRNVMDGRLDKIT
jgi:hypothetical protein